MMMTAGLATCDDLTPFSLLFTSSSPLPITALTDMGEFLADDLIWKRLNQDRRRKQVENYQFVQSMFSALEAKPSHNNSCDVLRAVKEDCLGFGC